jgi:hypothetical protein
MSLGADSVSIHEDIFCDMETAKWWPLCDEKHKYDCFDMESKTIKTNGKRSDAPRKEYTHTNEWKK